MLDREQNILTAAFEVFARYGVKRATMNDIAAEAGVARQTLYNRFSNKDAILLGLIEDYISKTNAAIEAHCASGGALEPGLELMFDHIARKPFELLRTTPHGDEIMEGINVAEKGALSRGYKGFVAAATPLFEGPDGRRAGPSPAELSELVVYATMSMKHKAESKTHLESLLGTLKTMVLNTASDAR